MGDASNLLLLNQLDQIYHKDVAKIQCMIKQMVQGSADDKVYLRSTLRRWLFENPLQFLRAVVEILREDNSDPSLVLIAPILSSNAEAHSFVSNPVLCNRRDAVGLARLLIAVDASYDVKLVRHAKEARWFEGGARLSQALEILSAVSDGSRIFPDLIQLMGHPDQHIRSKVALIVGRARKNPAWICGFMQDKDPRTRANAVEALIGETSPDAIRVLRIASADSHHRVAANAWLGLLTARQPDAFGGLLRMAASEKPADQAAAAWALGQFGSAECIPALKRLRDSPHSDVKRSALRALVAARRKSPNPPS
ncbi:MAG: hypothetical protein FJW20_15635 [Acidimicrobiia bacterium]|nr:hypothetical protein [Acidimicrobiia bacterium]